MQQLWDVPVADGHYVIDRAWEKAILESCPFHPESECGLERLGTYPRVAPAGTRIPRFWCPLEKASISLLPSFLACRLSGTLEALEAVVDTVERCRSRVEAVDALFPAEAEEPRSLAGALRFVRRRVQYVWPALLAIITIRPDLLEGCSPSLSAIRDRLGCDRVLERLRQLAPETMPALRAPLGLAPRGVT